MNPMLLNENANMPRKDYPRPQWARSSWYCLNGEWDFAFDFGRSGEARGMVQNGEFPLKICVPFCPESKLSGIEYTDFIPAVWYRRHLEFKTLPEGRAILHFGAVDYFCKVWVNGIFCGSHKGGYTSFDIEITKAIKEGENEIVVSAIDDQLSGRQARGKQCDHYHSEECSYTRTTGIYQTVWLEFVPDRYLKRAQTTPHALDGALDVRVFLDQAKPDDKVRISAFYQGKPVGEKVASVSADLATTQLIVDEIHLWNPCAPEIYDLVIELLDADQNVIDTVFSYFALRDVSLSDRALCINGKPIFMRMILDQGFHPDGVYTAPDDATLKRDIELSMKLGFNGARFHYRVFEDRSLYWADQLGYLVWAEHCIRDLKGPQGFCDFLPEWMETIGQYYNHPSVIGWMSGNETYNLRILDPEVEKMLYRVTKTLDPYRPVIDASGGQHYKTDLFDVHEYEQDSEKLAQYLKPMLEDDRYVHRPVLRFADKIPVRKEEYFGQPYWISECGGAIWAPENQSQEGWGYGETPKDESDFASRYENLISVMASNPRVCGFCYTQLTDVEQEQNGLYYYDRSLKFSEQIYDRILKANKTEAQIEKE